MKSRLLFRENGRVIFTRNQTRELAWLLVTLLAIIALLGWGNAVDEAALAEGQAGRAYESGQLVELLHLQEAVAAAYHQGRRDAGAACAKPEVAL